VSDADGELTAKQYDVMAAAYRKANDARARDRLGDCATVIRADLARPLDFAASASTDLIVSSLALHYLENWDAPPRPELQEREPAVGRRLTTAPAFLFFRLTKAQAT
jgi:hypothetical protein